MRVSVTTFEHQTYAEQFILGEPLPIDVVKTSVGYFTYNPIDAKLSPIHDGDWVLYKAGKVWSVEDNLFKAWYKVTDNELQADN